MFHEKTHRCFTGAIPIDGDPPREAPGVVPTAPRHREAIDGPHQRPAADAAGRLGLALLQVPREAVSIAMGVPQDQCGNLSRFNDA